MTWQVFTDEAGFEGHRAILEGYLVFLRDTPFKPAKRAPSGWFVHILMPEDERQKAFLAGPGFDRGVGLEEAKRIAEEVAKAGRGKLERQAQRRELEAKGQRSGKGKKRR